MGFFIYLIIKLVTKPNKNRIIYCFLILYHHLWWGCQRRFTEASSVMRLYEKFQINQGRGKGKKFNGLTLVNSKLKLKK